MPWINPSVKFVVKDGQSDFKDRVADAAAWTWILFWTRSAEAVGAVMDRVTRTMDRVAGY